MNSPIMIVFKALVPVSVRLGLAKDPGHALARVRPYFRVAYWLPVLSLMVLVYSQGLDNPSRLAWLVPVACALSIAWHWAMGWGVARAEMEKELFPNKIPEEWKYYPDKVWELEFTRMHTGDETLHELEAEVLRGSSPAPTTRLARPRL